MFPIEDRRDVLGAPFVRTGLLPAPGKAPECEHFRGRLAEPTIRRQGIHHVAQDRVVDAVADKAHDKVPKQLADEARRPALREVGEAEIAARDDQIVQIAVGGVLGQQAVEIHQSIPALLGDGQQRGLESFRSRSTVPDRVLEQPVEIGRDQPGATLRRFRQSQQRLVRGGGIWGRHVRIEDLGDLLAHGPAISHVIRLEQTHGRVITPGLDRGGLHRTRDDLQAGIEFVHQLGKPRQAGRIGYSGATEEDDAAFFVRLQQALGHIRTSPHKLHLGYPQLSCTRPLGPRPAPAQPKQAHFAR